MYRAIKTIRHQEGKTIRNYDTLKEALDDWVNLKDKDEECRIEIWYKDQKQYLEFDNYKGDF